MVSYYYKDNSKKLLRRDKKEAILDCIDKKFKTWYNDLTKSREEAIKVLKDIFPTWRNEKNVIKKIPSTYEQFKTYESAIYRATYQNYDSIVDIEGQDLRSNNIAGIYKASLVYDYNNIDLKSTLDKILFDWVTKGEGSAFISWREDIQQIPITEQVEVIDELTGEVATELVTTTKDITTFRGVDVKHIDPHNLYYDKSQRSNWESCGKIYRDFIPIQNILANTSYTFTAEEKKDLFSIVEKKDDTNDLEEQRVSQDTINIGDTIEVLEYYGDFMIPDTQDIIKNAEIVIIGRKVIAKIEKSKRPKCPIVYNTYLSRPDTDRGQSPMKPATILNDVENMCIDLTLKAWKLNVDPVFLSPKGAFTTYQRLIPGKPLEYDPSILGSQSPQKIDFSSGLKGFDFEAFFKQKMEGATGITQYLLGSQDGSVRTASESTYIHAGATMRVAREAYLFQNRIILPIVKLHALYKKIFDTQDRTVRLNDGTFAMVTEEVRNGDYTFIVGDSQSAVEREAETQKLFELLQAPAFQSLANLMDTNTALEFLKWILNRMNFKSTNQLLDIVTLTTQIQQVGREMGVRNENMNGFTQDMTRAIPEVLPQIAKGLYESQVR